jgi:hypothetical protein
VAGTSGSDQLEIPNTVKLGAWSLGPGEEKVIPMIHTPRTTGTIEIDGLIIGNGVNDQIACAPVSAVGICRPAVGMSARIRPSGDRGYSIYVEVSPPTERKLKSGIQPLHRSNTA